MHCSFLSRQQWSKLWLYNCVKAHVNNWSDGSESVRKLIWSPSCFYPFFAEVFFIFFTLGFWHTQVELFLLCLTITYMYSDHLHSQKLESRGMTESIANGPRSGTSNRSRPLKSTTTGHTLWVVLWSFGLKTRNLCAEQYQDPLMTPKNWHKQLQWSNQRQLLNSYSLGRRGLAIPNLEMCFVFVSFKIPVIIEMLFSYDKPLHCIHSVQ